MTSKRHLWALVNRDRTRRYNWVKLVLGWLCEEVKKYKTKKQTYCRVRIEGFDVPDVIPLDGGDVKQPCVLAHCGL